MRIKISLLLLLFGLGSFAQNHLKVGLALSGGGAKGMAHIGVLRALEEHNVKIDYISGTSMGAVVGAMYSIGYSVDQIEAYLKNVDWDALLDNTLPRNHLSVLDRESAERYILDFEVVDDKILAADAFNKGQYMLKELSFLTFPEHGQTDFSKFDIPFLCVGTDLATGEEMIFEEGELSGALRASLAFPSMFSPFKIKGRKYVDGGVVNNLPISVLKDSKGMDFIIASNVQGRLYTEEELVSVIQILEQVSSYANAMAYKEQKKKASLLINPPVLDYSLTAYELADTISKIGYDEAVKYEDVFKKLPQKSIARDTVVDLRNEDKIYIKSIEVNGADQTTVRFVKSKMRLKKPTVYSTKKLNAGLDRLYGSSYYDHLYFDLIPADTGYNLILKLKERKSSMTLRTGLHYDDDFGIGILANITLRNALLANSRFSMDVVFSENIRGKIAYVYDRGFIPALGVQIAFHRFGTKIYDNREAITSLTYQDFSISTFLTSTFSNNYSLGGGVKYENVNYLEDFQTLGIGRFNNNYLHTYVYLDFDNFNRKYKPSKGFKLKSEFRTIARQQEGVKFFDASSVLYAKYDQAIKINRKLGINTTLLAGGTIGPDMDLPYNIYFGGLGENYNNYIFPFLGYRYMELFGRTAVMGRLDFYVEPAKNHFITAKANIGKLEPTIEGLFNESILLDGYGISYGYNSPFGPLEFTLIASSNHNAILSYLSLGFWF